MQRFISGMPYRMLLVLCSLTFYCQEVLSQKNNQFSFEVIGSVFFNSERHAYQNGDQGIYSEFRVGRSLNKYFDVHIGAGYQSRYFIYYAQKDGVGYLPLFMERHYVPVNAAMRLYLSEFFYEKLKAWKKPGRFDVYYQLGVSTLRGKDVFDESDESFKSQGFYVPFYLYPYEQEYGKIYLTNLLGLRYNFNPHLGIFVEGGDGALMTFQTGLSAHF